METIGKNRHGVLTQTEFFRHNKMGFTGLASPIYSQGKFIILFSYAFLLLTIFFLTPLELKAQQNKNVYKVAIDKEDEPYEFLNDKNIADGFTPSLLKEIGKKTGVTFEFVPMTLPAAINALKSGEVDIVNMITSQERALQFDFSKPHSRITQALFRNAQNEEIKNLNSFKVVEKDTIGQVLSALGDGQWNIPKLLQQLNEVLPEKLIIKDYEVEHEFEQIGQRVMILNACQVLVTKKIANILVTGLKNEEKEEEKEEDTAQKAAEAAAGLSALFG